MWVWVGLMVGGSATALPLRERRGCANGDETHCAEPAAVRLALALVFLRAQPLASLPPPDPAWFLLDPTAPLPTASPPPPGAVAPNVYDTSGGRQCTGGLVCVSQANPFFGFISFDHILWAWLTIFQCITMEGWTDIQYTMQVGGGEHVRQGVGPHACKAGLGADEGALLGLDSQFVLHSICRTGVGLSVTDLTPKLQPNAWTCPQPLRPLS